jgi:hypothetical protein
MFLIPGPTINVSLHSIFFQSHTWQLLGLTRRNAEWIETIIPGILAVDRRILVANRRRS